MRGQVNCGNLRIEVEIFSPHLTEVFGAEPGVFPTDLEDILDRSATLSWYVGML